MITYRARIFTPLQDPFRADDIDSTYAHHEDGYLSVDGQGLIAGVGAWADRPREMGTLVELSRSILLTPGFIDTHLHAPQLEMIGSYGGHLLEWLNLYTFPTEARFADPDYARTISAALFDELLKHGTTSALIFSSVHAQGTNLLFEEAERRGIRAIIGKAMMDRNAPDALLESAEENYRNSRDLLLRWHGKGLLRYAISPRFAPTSSPELLRLAGSLVDEFPDAYVHTHVSENANEVAWVRELFPSASSYVDVYDQAGLLHRRSILAHGLHLTDDELTTLRDRDSRISHCPNSNLFLGSGLFPMMRVTDAGITIGLGSDIGAGTTPSLFNAMADAYKVQQVQNISLTPFHLWFLATLGGAKTLSLDDVTGSLVAGKEADFLALDLEASSLVARRTAAADAIQDILAGMIFMGDDRLVQRTFVKGREVSRRH